MFSSSAKHAAGVVVGQGHILRLRRCIHTTPYNALMPRTVHASITSQQQVALATLRRRPDLKPVERDRIEMILLSARGWTVQQLSAHLQYHGETMRRWLQAWQRQGVAAITVRPKGPPPDAARRHTVTAARRQLWQEPPAGSSPELASALGTRFQIQLSARSTRRYLQEMDATFRRTKASLQHKQDPVAVIQARSELDALKKKPGRGRSSSFTWMKAAMP